MVDGMGWYGMGWYRMGWVGMGWHGMGSVRISRELSEFGGKSAGHGGLCMSIKSQRLAAADLCNCLYREQIIGTHNRFGIYDEIPSNI